MVTHTATDYHIRVAQYSDLPQVLGLEQTIKGKNAAHFETLAARLSMHPQGFLVAAQDTKIVAYLQSCIWDRPAFENFDKIEDFSRHHNENGNEAYVIFLAVAPHTQRQGIASKLLKHKITLATMQNLNTVSLVAKASLLSLHQKSGFDIVCDIPDFLPHGSEHHFLMQRHLENTTSNFMHAY